MGERNKSCQWDVRYSGCNCGVFKFTHHRRKASLARSLLERKMMTGKLSMKETGRGNRVEEGVGERSTSGLNLDFLLPNH